jgi:hypothetical protein
MDWDNLQETAEVVGFDPSEVPRMQPDKVDLLIAAIRDTMSPTPSPRDWGLLMFCLHARQMNLPFPNEIEQILFHAKGPSDVSFGWGPDVV